jgi:hypothetical protein
MLVIDSTPSLELTLESISLEANVLTNAVSTIKNLFPNLLRGISNSFNKQDSLPQVEVLYTKLQNSALYKLKHVDHLDLDALSVVVPEGFISDYITALKVSMDGINYMNSVANNVLKNYKVYVSMVISNRDDKTSLRDNSSHYKEYARSRDIINQEFSKLYKSNSFEVSRPFTKLIRRNSDVNVVFHETNKLLDLLKMIDIRNVKDQTNSISDLLQIVIDQVEAKKIDNVSPETLKNLATGAYEVAKQVETFSACYFRIKTIVESIDVFTKQLDSYL